MFNIANILISTFAKSAQVRAKVVFQKAMIGGIAGILLLFGGVFLVVALYIVGSRFVGPAGSAGILGGMFIAAGIGVLVYNRRKLKRATPSGFSPAEAAAAAAEDPTVAPDGSIVPPPHKIVAPVTLEERVGAAIVGDFSQVAHLAAEAVREVKNPKVGFPVAGLALGYLLASQFRKDE